MSTDNVTGDDRHDQEIKRVSVLMRRRMPRPDDHPDNVDRGLPHCVFRTMGELGEALESIERANGKYELKEVGVNQWRIGPDEDQGFFGHRPVELWVVSGVKAR